MSDDDILMRGGTEEDIAMYAHDVGRACMYPDYPCEICEAREKQKEKEEEMNSPEDDIIEEEIREGWWEQGEAVMREMCEEDDG